MSSRNQTETAKETKKSIMYNMCDTIDQAKHDNNGRVPFGFVAGLVQSHVAVCPWLSRDDSASYDWLTSMEHQLNVCNWRI